MPSQPESALAEIRRNRPEAPPELRRRVQQLARLEPAPPRRLVTRRRLVLVLAAGVLVAAIAAGVLRQGAEEGGGDEAAVGMAESAPAQRDTTVPEAELGGRLSDFQAELGVRVDDVASATQQAMRIAQSLGGFVVSAQYDGGESDSLLLLSVPIGRAQDAIDRLSRLGELTSQRFSLQDLQSTVDQLDAQADRLQERIATLERQLRNPALTPGERVALRNRLEQAERELQDVLAQRDGTVAQGRSAEITLTLTGGPEDEPAASGVIGRAVDALSSVWTWVLAVLIVGAPFAVLLAAAFLLGRRLRRRANEKLLG